MLVNSFTVKLNFSWLKHFSEASEAYSRREGKPSRIPAAPMVLPQLEPDSDAETPRESSIDSTATVNLKQEENQPSAEPETVPTEENHRVNVEDPGAGGDQTPGECFITFLHKNT